MSPSSSGCGRCGAAPGRSSRRSSSTVGWTWRVGRLKAPSGPSACRSASVEGPANPADDAGAVGNSTRLTDVPVAQRDPRGTDGTVIDSTFIATGSCNGGSAQRLHANVAGVQHQRPIGQAGCFLLAVSDVERGGVRQRWTEGSSVAHSPGVGLLVESCALERLVEQEGFAAGGEPPVAPGCHALGLRRR